MDLLHLRGASTALIDESLWLQLRPLLAGIFRLRSGYSSATDPLRNFTPTGSYSIYISDEKCALGGSRAFDSVAIR